MQDWLMYDWRAVFWGVGERKTIIRYDKTTENPDNIAYQALDFTSNIFTY